MGHRNPLGLALNPVTGEIWENEDGPNGGDEINVLQPGKNYGWPVVSYGRFYLGPRVSENPWKEGMEPPLVFWVPAIASPAWRFTPATNFPHGKGACLSAACEPARSHDPDTWSGSTSTTSGKNCTAKGCSAISRNAFAMCARDPTVCSTCSLRKTMAL